ncbi:TetR family transcriptional regulator C-terminal domain-containing protein [Dyadobacter jiangsuensis]|uniref:TetR/AcrR family transcriptional regulator n=1 Tax=Dyadobacter fermentans TaxID=94254 RepID=UPI001CBBA111|nr:TetR/AcrR family transcriptional regulator [Dyadobacter fermentans]MBZ1360197.1 TetR/AcrR family transcriptional regulator [Dyadobacter fermentans]
MNVGTTKAERTRNFIIEKTAEIFNRKGYAGTSMSDITEATGLTKGSIYGNFENKEEVALAVFEYNRSLVFNTVQAQLEKAETYFEKLMVYGRVYRDVIASVGDRGGCPILNTAVEADDTNVPLQLSAAKALLSWKKNIVGMIEKGTEAGEFRQGVNAEQMAVSIIALIEGGVMLSKVTNDYRNMDHVLATVQTLVRVIKA